MGAKVSCHKHPPIEKLPFCQICLETYEEIDETEGVLMNCSKHYCCHRCSKVYDDLRKIECHICKQDNVKKKSETYITTGKASAKRGKYHWEPEHDLSIHIGIVGQPAIGKRTLVSQYVDNGFVVSPETRKSNFRTKQEYQMNLDSEIVLWYVDSNGTIPRIYLSDITNALGVLLCFSIQDRKSFNTLRKLYVTTIQNIVTRRPFMKLILIGTKSDQWRTRVIGYKEASLWASRRGIPYIEISSNEWRNVEMAFKTLIDNILFMPQLQYEQYLKIIHKV